MTEMRRKAGAPRRSFLKKRTKKLLRPGSDCHELRTGFAKVFCFFSSEKKALSFAQKFCLSDASAVNPADK
jgi:hypothetical protein